MNKKLLVGILASGIIATTGVSAFANSQVDNRDTIRTALQNNDYQSWSQAITDTPMGEELLSHINSSNFTQYVEAENLMKEGKTDEAKTIFDSLGVKGNPGFGPHGNKEIDPTKLEEMKTTMTAIETALDNSDYTAWQSAVSELPNSTELLNKITSSNFDQYVEAHKLMKESKTILTNLGVEGFGPGGFGPGKHGGPQNDTQENFANQTTDSSSSN